MVQLLHAFPGNEAWKRHTHTHLVACLDLPMGKAKPEKLLLAPFPLPCWGEDRPTQGLFTTKLTQGMELGGGGGRGPPTEIPEQRGGF